MELYRKAGACGLRWSAALAAMAGAAGCTPPLDRATDVRDLRVLAVRAEPPELMDSPLAPQVTFEALVVDPRYPDVPIELSWELCPVESSRACANYESSLDSAYDSLEQLAGLVGAIPVGGPGGGGVACPLGPEILQGFGRFAELLGAIADRSYLDRHRGAVAAERFIIGVQPPADPQPVGDVSLASADLRFLRDLALQMAACGLPVPPAAEIDSLPADATDLHLFHLLTNPLASLLGVWPSVVLTARGVDAEVVAQKRLVVGWRRPSGPLAIFRLFAPTVDLGVPVCAAGGGQTNCLAAQERVPNHNPVLVDVQIGSGDPDHAVWTSLRVDADEPRDPWAERAAALAAPSEGRAAPAPAPAAPGPLTLWEYELEPGQSVRLLPVFSAASFEPYQTVRIDPDDLSLTVTDEVEEISVSWYTSGGRVAEELTWPTLTVGYDTRFTAPPDPPPGFDPNLRVWMVARDQRGGTTWQEVHLRLRDPR